MMMTNHEHFMRLAVEKARQGIAEGQTPFGACIIKEGEAVSCEHNVVWQTCDITAHAEVHAIRKACRMLNTIDLSGCVMYSTCEPCPMCFSAIHWAKIAVIVYGADIKDAKQAGFHELEISNDQMKQAGQSSIKIVSGILKKECAELFGEWKERKGKGY
jgi:tRNA(Arg) A34 adenosine deaminase TadA